MEEKPFLLFCNTFTHEGEEEVGCLSVLLCLQRKLLSLCHQVNVIKKHIEVKSDALQSN